ncbi:MAG: histidine phosphatase family protein [Dehalococcoidia bacterium]|nr:histidine phosphatase family protein [Dehalococcoidia bacterium]
MILILARHGETAWNQERRIQGGSSDTELSEVGIKQAERLGLALKETNIDAIYSSPLKRAYDTAQAIASRHRLTVQIEPDLREMEVGELEGISIAELGTSFGQFLLQWRQGQGVEKLPGGESVAELADRVWATIERIIKRQEEGTVVVVSHFFTVVVTICKALGWPLTTLERVRVQTGSISIIDLGDGQPRLLSLGDTCHLKEG